MLVDSAMPMPYEMNAGLRDAGMVYMIGRLYQDHLLSKQNLVAEYEGVYDYIVQYASNANAPNYCRDLATRLRDGN
ncbi:hypothetical protein JAAARDRAFT_41506 [Jaapia argillacea MUCL 33604]|uniref:Uncharacterized protein n=1 Tax=Jaapia argillacea MUCL 33604 TaxID=933084 RepID=A0A067PJ44_9AGAM|nr:hypothetical protein JAAARDRAFT_41506 [Jaapia argillacea MUCL 33604]